MKEILILNPPEDFDYRRCSIGGDGNIYYEREGEQRTSIIGNIKNLKPMPEKIDFRADYKNLPWAIKRYEEITGHKWSNMMTNKADGWNECIDEILSVAKENEL